MLPASSPRLFKTGSYFVKQAGLELAILFSQPPKYWHNSRYAHHAQRASDWRTRIATGFRPSGRGRGADLFMVSTVPLTPYCLNQFGSLHRNSKCGKIEN